MPPSDRDYFVQALRERWDSTFLELILARMVQLLGGQFCMEQQNAEGNRPDFHADFGGHQVTIEVISPVFESKADKERSQDAPLLELINRHAPSGWSISVNQLPDIGLADSKKEFRQVLLQLFRELPTETEERWYTATRQLSSGRLQLSLFPAVLGHAPIVSGPMYSYSYEDAEARIRHAIQKKRRQVRAETRPVLLAVHASGFGATFEDFDRALFGRTLTLVGCGGHSMTTRFEANGLFAKPGKDQPTYAGVLAFKRLSFKYTSDPVMYLHPRFDGYLPAELLQFEQRRLQHANEISIRSASRQHILSELGFIPHDL
jgi:hypothetical protein